MSFILPILTLLSVFTLLPLFSALSPPPNSANLSVHIGPISQGRLFAISDTAPFAANVQQEPDYRAGLKLLSHFFTLVERDITQSRRRSKSSKTVRTRPCNTEPQAWQSATYAVSQHRGWPVTPRNDSFPSVCYVCVTDYYGPPLAFPLSLPHMRHVLVRYFEALERNAYRIMLDTVGNWTHATSGQLSSFEWTSQTCELSSFRAFRIRNKWYNAVGITNQPPYFHLPDGQRIVIAEAHRLENGTIVPALMTLPINPGTGVVHNVTDRATTIITTWGGASDPSSGFLPGIAERNVALLAARQKGEHCAQQMEDVLLASNIAILGFPLALNLVPVALITDCDQWSMIVYILLSDVLTALPMLIKGIELVTIGKARFVQAVTRMGDTLDQGTIAAEVTMAVCRMRQDAGTIGVVFICIACVAIVFGVALEFLARLLVWKNKERRRLEEEERLYFDQYERARWKQENEFYRHGNVGVWDETYDAIDHSLRPRHDLWAPM